jgi:hypothetical protein
MRLVLGLFLSLHLGHKDLPDFVKAAWRGEQGWNEAVDGFRDRVTRWNKEVFGNMK